MHGDAAGGETSGRTHRDAPSPSQQGVECQSEHEQDGAAEDISLDEETDHRDRVHCRHDHREFDDPGPALGAIEVERQLHPRRAYFLRVPLTDPLTTAPWT